MSMKFFFDLSGGEHPTPRQEIGCKIEECDNHSQFNNRNGSLTRTLSRGSNSSHSNKVFIFISFIIFTLK